MTCGTYAHDEDHIQMKVFEIRDAWGLDHLTAAERPEPEPGPTEILLAMRAASLNFRDHVMLQRGYGARSGELPLVPVSDGAGEVIAVGAEVTRFEVGDLVCPCFAQSWITGPLKEDYWSGMLGGPRDGVLQQFMATDETAAVKAPAGWDALRAATLPCAALTAWNAIVSSGGIKAGDTVLVQGTGGVSLFALQFARMHGARVIATSGNSGKLARVEALGADEVINYRENAEWARAARALTDGHGVDLVVEVGGAGTLEQSLRAVRVGGVVALIGVLSGARAAVNLGLVVTRDLNLKGVTLGNRDMFEAMVAAIERNPLTPQIDDRLWAFDDAPGALAALPEGQHYGKICIGY